MTKLNLRFQISLLFLASLLLFLIVFYMFRLSDAEKTEQLKSNIVTVLSSEVNLSNIYAISKYLADLERLKVFKCARLDVQSLNTVYYDTQVSESCQNLNFRSFRTVDLLLKSSNGQLFKLSFIRIFDLTGILLEIFIYSVLMIIVITFPRYLKSVEQKSRVRVRALEIEKEFILNHAQQISHDVASPLSALGMILKLLKDVDPEVKLILENSLDRTFQIFNELRYPNQNESSLFNLNRAIKSILNEKEIAWEDHVSIEFIAENDLMSCRGSESEFKRIISNILNNSYEAMQQSTSRKISVKIYRHSLTMVGLSISDTGKGIPSDIISSLGNRGVTFGKENSKTAGKGLGLYHAKKTLGSWSGDLTITSELKVGTTIQIVLPNSI